MLIRPNEITHDVIGSAIEVHRIIGPGLFESACHECLACEFTLRGMSFETQVPIPLIYKGVDLE